MGTISELVPDSYWADLEVAMPEHPVAQLKRLSDAHKQVFKARDLGLNEERSTALLDRFAQDGWVNKEESWECPVGLHDLPIEEAEKRYCTTCGVDLDSSQPPKKLVRYSRQLQRQRVVNWVVAVHGMKSRGEWQEHLVWLLGTTWGRSVPVAVYKYGFIVAGVVMFWRRRQFVRELRAKLVALRGEADQHGYRGNPDVIAHSFGTWLVGHLCLEEAKRPESERLNIGRIILYGSILRPDFDWQAIINAGVVEAVLNHFGDKDGVVPLAHYTIWDSGPSGRRGFDAPGVLNLRAVGHDHNSLFATDRFVKDGTPHLLEGQPTESHLHWAYVGHWMPFLKAPLEDVQKLGTGRLGASDWRQSWWPLRGTLFPLVALPFVACLLLWLPFRAIEFLGPFAKFLNGAMLVSSGAFLGYALWMFGSMILRKFKASS